MTAMAAGPSPVSHLPQSQKGSYLSKNVPSAVVKQPMFLQTQKDGEQSPAGMQLSPSLKSSDRMAGDDESFNRPGEISGLGVIEDLNELQDMRITDMNPFTQKNRR